MTLHDARFWQVAPMTPLPDQSFIGLEPGTSPMAESFRVRLAGPYRSFAATAGPRGDLDSVLTHRSSHDGSIDSTYVALPADCTSHCLFLLSRTRSDQGLCSHHCWLSRLVGCTPKRRVALCSYPSENGVCRLSVSLTESSSVAVGSPTL